MLPAQYRWLHARAGSYLHYNFKCVAVVYADGRVHLQGWGQDRGHVGRSHALSVRLVERWVCARRGFP